MIRSSWTRARVARWRWAAALVLLLTLLPAARPIPTGATDVTTGTAYSKAISIPASGTSGTADLYPATFTKSGMCGPITRVRVRLNKLKHANTSNLDVLLVAPGGQKLLILSDIPGASVSNATLTFDDAAGSVATNLTGVTTASYKPSNIGSGDVFDAPAPSGPYPATTFAGAFNGTDANGTWQLFIIDDTAGDIGTLVGGWELFITVDCAVLHLPVVGNGVISRNPQGTGDVLSGGSGYAYGAGVTLTAKGQIGSTFVGWTADGAGKGWASPLTLTMDADHGVQATFAPAVTFADVSSSRADYAAIVALATRGYIRGYNASSYGPDDGVQRAQMAALIARATPAGPGSPPSTLMPPACTVAATWDCEDWSNGFTDQDGLDGNLWRDVAALQHYGVASGYAAGDCAARGKVAPCFGPTDPVTYAETIVFITRAMVAKGYWQNQPSAPQPYSGVPAIFATAVATYAFYTGGVQDPPADWNAGATRGWFARQLWTALDSYWGTDGTLPDGTPAGGYAP